MKILDSSQSSSFIKLKDEDWLLKQRVAGRAVAATLTALESLVMSKTSKSLIELNEIGEEIIATHGCTPTFKGYKGFPAGVCISVNKHLVHGIPNDSVLQEGDVVKFDLGATFEGAIADSALTCIFGEARNPLHKKLVEATKKSLELGIAAIAVGKPLGVIGNAIYKYGREQGFSVVTDYGGHGIDLDRPHAPPFVANRSDPNEGVIIQPGLTIAIEPMLIAGSTSKSKTLEDGWTVVTYDIGAHFEHSVFVHEDRVEIITARD